MMDETIARQFRPPDEPDDEHEQKQRRDNEERRILDSAKSLLRANNGREALADICDWLESWGHPMSPDAQECVLCLLEGAWQHGADMVVDAINEALED